MPLVHHAFGAGLVAFEVANGGSFGTDSHPKVRRSGEGRVRETVPTSFYPDGQTMLHGMAARPGGLGSWGAVWDPCGVIS